jgi:hypothetical protein
MVASQVSLFSREAPFMKTPLIDYLVDMELDPGKATAFRKNPGAAMAAAGLSKKLRTVLESRKLSRIERAMDAEKPFEPVLCKPPFRLFNTIQ